ncbi:uncharacterized protein BKA55DRAFT_697677 [Fusarium redolens]|uniref:Uncharacterized protein n=1 Tax=Fusarium redolens TaxID=48865 RepID=A0A9P9FW01_FUSRE|nr:uncharacterized protein BKA55DRAFT_697677 [Fusarium redolens]KAH7216968.1 hypothetical protein BKA55DRAFT_697677 [Fusarium redolens]
MPDGTENPKKNTTDLSIEANKASKAYLSYLQDEVQRLKDEEGRDQWMLELVERNELLEKEIQRMAEQIKESSPGKEQEAKK